MKDVLVEGPGGIRIIPAGSGFADLTHLTEGQKLNLLSEFEELDDTIDIFLVDTGATLVTISGDKAKRLDIDFRRDGIPSTAATAATTPPASATPKSRWRFLRSSSRQGSRLIRGISRSSSVRDRKQ